MSAAACPRCSRLLDYSLTAVSGDTLTVCPGCRQKFPVSSAVAFAEFNQIGQPPPPLPARDHGGFVDDEPQMKTCQFCRSNIPAAASKCSHCQEWVAGTKNSKKYVQFNPGVAAALSLVMPGLGQIYKTQLVSGFIWMFLVVIGYVSFIIPGLFLHLICVADAGSSKPVRMS
jgi:TM2 domain-containing membrane protein YozV